MKNTHSEFRVAKIFNGVDINRFRPVTSLDEKKKLRQVLDLPSDSKIVVTCGGINKRKGIDFLLDVWSSIISETDNCVFVILGPLDKLEGYSKVFTDEIIARSQNTDYKGNLFLRGNVPNVEEYFRAADVFAFAGRQEGSPNVLRESLASGLPVVSLELKDITSDMIINGHNGIIIKVKDQERLNDWRNRDISEPELIARFTDAILKILSDSEFSARIAKEAIKTAEEKFTITEQVRQLIRLVEES